MHGTCAAEKVKAPTRAPSSPPACVFIPCLCFHCASAALSPCRPALLCPALLCLSRPAVSPTLPRHPIPSPRPHPIVPLAGCSRSFLPIPSRPPLPLSAIQDCCCQLCRAAPSVGSGTIAGTLSPSTAAAACLGPTSLLARPQPRKRRTLAIASVELANLPCAPPRPLQRCAYCKTVCQHSQRIDPSPGRWRRPHRDCLDFRATPTTLHILLTTHATRPVLHAGPVVYHFFCPSLISSYTDYHFCLLAPRRVSSSATIPQIHFSPWPQSPSH